MMVKHIFNHVRLKDTPRDLFPFLQVKSQHDDSASIEPKEKHEKIGMNINPGYFGKRSQNVFSNPIEHTIVIRA